MRSHHFKVFQQSPCRKTRANQVASAQNVLAGVNQIFSGIVTALLTIRNETNILPSSIRKRNSKTCSTPEHNFATRKIAHIILKCRPKIVLCNGFVPGGWFNNKAAKR